MNDARLETLLEELYAIDGDLKAHGPALRALVAELLASKPSPVIDERFAAELRRKLLARATSSTSAASTSLIASIGMRRFFTYAVPGLAVLAIAVLGVMTLGPAPRSGDRLALQSGSPSRGFGTVERLGDGAFGALSASSAPRPESGGGSRAAAAGAVALETGAVPPSAGGDTAKMIAPGEPYVPTVYTYVYKGEAIDGLLSPKVDVYKPSTVKTDAPVPADLLTRLGFGLADLTRLRSVQIQSFSVVEDRDYGYAVWVDLASGGISFSQNGRWPHAAVEWDPATGLPKDPIRPSEVPTEAEAVRIADAFLAEYGIDRSRYGTPKLRDDWRVLYETSADKSLVYVPEAVSVVYPELVDGKEILEPNGAPAGLEVSVHARLRRVTGAWNLAARTYAASAYEGETDSARVLDIASKGGPMAWYPDRGEYRTVEVAIGTPTGGLVRSWQPDGELFVTALLFPLIDAPAELAWQKVVAVPLAKELLTPPLRVDGPGKPIPLESR